MENDKKVADREQTDDCKYLAYELWSEAETYLYLKRARQMGKSLMTAST